MRKSTKVLIGILIILIICLVSYIIYISQNEITSTINIENETQNEVENEKTFIEAYGEAYAAKVDCHPGASEHQLGLLADFGTRDGYCRLDTCFSGTGASNWLQENAWKYGWIERHPAGKEAVTGTMYSPWNYRYVGKAFAKELYESGLTMEEYFQVSQQS